MLSAQLVKLMVLHAPKAVVTSISRDAAAERVVLTIFVLLLLIGIERRNFRGSSD